MAASTISMRPSRSFACFHRSAQTLLPGELRCCVIREARAPCCPLSSAQLRVDSDIVTAFAMGTRTQKRGDRRRRCTRGRSMAVVGMAANPSGAHQAGRHRAGRVRWSVPSRAALLGTPIHRSPAVIESRHPPLDHLQRQRRHGEVNRRGADIPRRHAHAVVRPHMAIEHEGDAAGVDRRIREGAPPRASHREVDVGGRAGPEARQVPGGPQRQAARPDRHRGAGVEHRRRRLRQSE